MKRNFAIVAACIIISMTFTSCEPLNMCKICKKVTYEGNNIISEDPEKEYCNADLVAIQSMQDVIIGSTRTTWECR